jgi:gliding motility-associated-like protein
LSCLNCPDPITRPFETITYSLVAIDSFGCSANDEITISVKKSRNVYIPTAFSPNGDGTNDEFFVFAGPSAVKINQFTIFTRWGEVVYQATDILPNDRTTSWNGEFKGERLNPGVFIYLIEIAFVDGKVITYKGDITLMK